MREESAVIRTPVEIWLKIFEFALQWLELPAEDDAPLKYINFKWGSCTQYHLYSYTLYNRRNFRHVCRSWRQMIESGHAPYTVRPLPKDQDGNQTNFSRMNSSLSVLNSGEFISTAGYSNICIPPCFRGFDSTPQYNAKSKFYDLKLDPLPIHEHLIRLLPVSERNPHVQSGESGPHITISQTKLLLIRKDTPTVGRDFSSLVRYAKDLRALSWTPVYPRQLSFLDHLISITMLNLLIVPVQQEWTTKELILPTLRYLRICFRQVDPSKELMTSWTFSKLSVLQVIDRGGGLGYILASFISRHCDTISALVFYSHKWLYEDRWYGEISLWTCLQRLSLLGVSPRWFVDGTRGVPPPAPVTPSSKPLTIFLYNFTAFWMDLELGPVETASLLVNWCKSVSSSIELISMEGSWRDVKQQVNRGRDDVVQEKFCKTKAVLEEMTKGGIPFCDRDGILLPSGDITSFLKSE